jgi:hypothetical protein
MLGQAYKPGIGLELMKKSMINLKVFGVLSGFLKRNFSNMSQTR